jgi:hypothetical protein
MSAPGPAWSAEEEELLRSLAAAGESAAAIATRLKRSNHAVRKRADLLEIKLARPFAARAEAEVEVIPCERRGYHRTTIKAR